MAACLPVRKATTDIEVHGKRIPAGSILFMSNIYSLAADPPVWPPVCVMVRGVGCLRVRCSMSVMKARGRLSWSDCAAHEQALLLPLTGGSTSPRSAAVAPACLYLQSATDVVADARVLQ